MTAWWISILQFIYWVVSIYQSVCWLQSLGCIMTIWVFYFPTSCSYRFGPGGQTTLFWATRFTSGILRFLDESASKVLCSCPVWIDSAIRLWLLIIFSFSTAALRVCFCLGLAVLFCFRTGFSTFCCLITVWLLEPTISFWFLQPMNIIILM